MSWPLSSLPIHFRISGNWSGATARESLTLPGLGVRDHLRTELKKKCKPSWKMVIHHPVEGSHSNFQPEKRTDHLLTPPIEQFQTSTQAGPIHTIDYCFAGPRCPSQIPKHNIMSWLESPFKWVASQSQVYVCLNHGMVTFSLLWETDGQDQISKIYLNTFKYWVL